MQSNNIFNLFKYFSALLFVPLIENSFFVFTFQNYIGEELVKIAVDHSKVVDKTEKFKLYLIFKIGS